MTERGPQRLVVVGNGLVGHRLVEAMAARDTARSWTVTVLAEEPHAAYDRIALSSLFAGTAEEELRLAPARAETRLGDPVVAIDREGRTVTTASGTTHGYDHLVLATGSAPFVPPIPGADRAGCFVYRTLDDVTALKEAGAHATSGAVIGGGLLGLEAADALRRMGLETHVVEYASRLMPVQLDEGGAEALRLQVERLGIRVHTDARTAAIEAGLRLVFEDRPPLEVDMVVFSAGIRPRDALAREAGLALGPRGGIAVDGACRTSDARISAIGEVAALDGQTFGLVAPGYAMAEVVADRLLGGAAEFADADTSAKLKLLGVEVASFGDAHGATDGALGVVYANPITGVYKKLVLSDDATRLLGGILVGDAGEYALLRPLVGSDVPLPDDPAKLLSLGDGETTAGPVALPGSALVCTCQGVSKDSLCGAIGDGAHDLGELKACTKAGTGCGSCVPLVKAILGEELTKQGVTLSKALCEHFDHSRAELFDIVRVTGITTFSQLLADYGRGRGRGCDICKPVAASIFASLGGGHVMKGEAGALQDTNDHFMANIQRDGTYSVVPRIPGGEITPQKLKVIAEVADDFGLYTKITGAQRIDMLGARLEQLPEIWRRLVDAGFESGHAYGKALRTVKSCVGSTWCRFGVQDSVTLAIDLELRYRGLRAPHKIKSAVSGCARECAEARGKDFGVIATENGWNLFVGGNGGFTPRHAELLAQDLDRETLIRTIDRFLMFYVRTADRLQRTAAWIESLDGGLDYLRSVIVDDSLGICAELDAMMAAHVASYADEWRGALEDPETLSRFVTFVNAPEQEDTSVVFVSERGQPRPATVPERKQLKLIDQEVVSS